MCIHTHTRACVCANSLQVFPTLCHPMDCGPPSYSVLPGISPGKNTGVGCHEHLQGIFPTQKSNPHLLCLLLCRQIIREAYKYMYMPMCVCVYLYISELNSPIPVHFSSLIPKMSMFTLFISC